MPVRAEYSVPAIRDRWERQTGASVWRRDVGMHRGARAHPTFRPEPCMEVSADFCVACLWSALGLTLTGLFFALGLGAEIGQILAMAG
jgi:hypothetical protein